MKLSQKIAIRRAIQARKVATVETAAPAPKVGKPKRVMTENQAQAWNTRILPRLQAGRARKAAEKAAA